MNAVSAPLFVSVKDDFGIGAGAEEVPAPLQVAAEIPEVVDLAVEHNPDSVILIGHRLMAGGREVDYAQPRAAQDDGFHRGVYAPIVWAPVTHRIHHAPDMFRTLKLRSNQACDAAHTNLPRLVGAPPSGFHQIQVELLQLRDRLVPCQLRPHLRGPGAEPVPERGIFEQPAKPCANRSYFTGHDQAGAVEPPPEVDVEA